MNTEEIFEKIRKLLQEEMGREIEEEPDYEDYVDMYQPTEVEESEEEFDMEDPYRYLDY